MCLGPTHSSPTPQPVKEKDPVYLRNPYLDGLGISAENRGRNSLRIDPGSRVPTSADPGLHTGNPIPAPFYSGTPRHGPNLGIN